MKSFFTRLVASFFFVGYLPKMPGTWGSMAGIALAWAVYPLGFWWVLLLSILGFIVCRHSRIVFGDDDPTFFVIDEVCGVMVSVLWLPRTFMIYLAGFLLFRCADILKPGPIRWLQDHRSPLGIMADDLAAGVLVNVFLQFAIRWWAAIRP